MTPSCLPESPKRERCRHGGPALAHLQQIPGHEEHRAAGQGAADSARLAHVRTTLVADFHGDRRRALSAHEVDLTTAGRLPHVQLVRHGERLGLARKWLATSKPVSYTHLRAHETRHD